MGCKKQIIVMVLFPANKTIAKVLNVQLNWKAGQLKIRILLFCLMVSKIWLVDHSNPQI